MIKSTNFVVSEIAKFWYKRFNKTAYLEYKVYLKDQKLIKKYASNFESHIKSINRAVDSKKELNFIHSGHMGDLLYALPVIKELAKERKCNLFIRSNRTLGKKGYYKHPAGNIMINDRIYSMLLPLLQNQNYLHSINKWNGEEIDINLDLFRNLPFSRNFHSIRWYYHIAGVQPDMNLPFIDAGTDEKFNDKIVVVRTFRGRNPLIDYSFLTKYDNIFFLGVKDEYDDFVKSVPNTAYYDVKDFLELAVIMNSAKFVITNQTFAFALVDGLKTNRILEASPHLPAVFPTGKNGYDFYFQDQFEKLVAQLNDLSTCESESIQMNSFS